MTADVFYGIRPSFSLRFSIAESSETRKAAASSLRLGGSVDLAFEREIPDNHDMTTGRSFHGRSTDTIHDRGVFEDRNHADLAVSELIKAGFRQDQIGVAMRHDERRDPHTTTTDGGEAHTGEGAVAGALTGLGLGALAGLGVISGVIPVIGPAIAAGTLGVILSNAAAGAGIVGLVGALIGAGVPEHEAKYYHQEFEAGRTVVTVTSDGRGNEATAILLRHGAYDMSTRGAQPWAPQPRLSRARQPRASTGNHQCRCPDRR